MKRILGVLLVLACSVLLMAGTAAAKDGALERDMVVLEKTYIPPLFFTSAMNLQASVASMKVFKASWAEFSGKYYFYKPDYANWQKYFDEIEWAVQAADDIVQSAVRTGSVTILPQAHEELEAVRMVMLELRPKNGFPKFITDKLTIFHEPMEHIVLSVKGKTPADIDDALLAELAVTLKHANKAWDDVVKCPFDASLWALQPVQVVNYYAFQAKESAALENFAAALESGDKARIIQAGMAVKPNFVECYKTFGNFAMFAPK